MSDYFDILNDVSEYVTLIQGVENHVNVSCAVTISGVFIFNTIFKRVLP